MTKAVVEASEESIDALSEEYNVLKRSDEVIELEVPDMTDIFQTIQENEIPTEHINVTDNE